MQENSPPTNSTDGIRRGSDPTKAILSTSKLHKKHLCDYVINVATGCSHGCKFCYVPSTPNIRTRPSMLEAELGVENPQGEWGTYVLYRDEIPDKLPGILDRKRTWKETETGCGIVGVSFGTDCYMDTRAGEITRKVVEILSNHGKCVRLLTRNPVLASQHLPTYVDAGENVIVGSSINSMNANELRAIETNAPGPTHRIRGLQKFSDAGIPVYVSMAPTYPTMSRKSLETLMLKLKELDPEVVFHEPINPRGANFQMTVDAAWANELDELGRSLASLRDEGNWVEYATRHFKWVQEIGEEIGLPIHLWPDQQLVKKTTGGVSNWLQSWRERQSPEDFAGRNNPGEPLPTEYLSAESL